MKQKMFAMALVLVMGLALAACGNNDAKKDPEASTPTEQGGTSNPGGSDKDKDKDSEQDKEQDKEGDQDKEGAGETQPSQKPDGDGNQPDGGNSAVNASSTAEEMANALLEAVEQPMLVDMEADMLKDMYHLDADIAEDFVVKFPMMNVKSNEIAIFKVKDEATAEKVIEGIEQRAKYIQKQFESYLPDQYENAKNYKVITKNNVVLFVVSESSDQLIEVFNGFFED